MRRWDSVAVGSHRLRWLKFELEFRNDTQLPIVLEAIDFVPIALRNLEQARNVFGAVLMRPQSKPSQLTDREGANVTKLSRPQHPRPPSPRLTYAVLTQPANYRSASGTTGCPVPTRPRPISLMIGQRKLEVQIDYQGSRRSTRPGRLPIYPQQRTSSAPVGRSVSCQKRTHALQQTYSIISAARIADRPSSRDISHSFSCLKLAFLIPIQGRPSQSFIYDRRCGRINYQSGGPAPSSIFRELSYGKLFEDFFAFSLE